MKLSAAADALEPKPAVISALSTTASICQIKSEDETSLYRMRSGRARGRRHPPAEASYDISSHPLPMRLVTIAAIVLLKR
jgi:hypothetical protein